MAVNDAVAPTAVVDLTFSARLNRLFETAYPPGRGPYRDSEVTSAAADYGYPISRAYLSQLRSGRRRNPSDETVAALAAFFRVPTEYFTDDAYYASLQDELTWLARPRHDTVARIAVALLELSADSRRDIMHTVDQLHLRSRQRNDRTPLHRSGNLAAAQRV